ncbi:MAG: penicillin-binding protein 1C [Chlorobi bacterium]|nr:penicillin-binding protein 1C [Chlorobiota bacterium]
MILHSIFSTKKFYLIVLLILIIAFFVFPGKPLFHDPLSLVIESNEGTFLGAHIADDEQWRFPPESSIPEKFAKSLIEFEDKRFYKHPGVDPFALLRALYQNSITKKRKSGGSTITMQVIRLSRKGKPRTYFQKIIEIIKAVKLEIHYSKNEILTLYSSNAPFGGNVVGLSAASWRYFGKSPANLTWAESAMLAVLPNSPGLIHPGRNRKLLRLKRNRLLKKLLQEKIIAQETFELSCLEPIPVKPKHFPNIAPHLLDEIVKEQSHKKRNFTVIKTTINSSLQKKINLLLIQHYKKLSSSDINNIAVLVVKVENAEVLAYNANVNFSKKTIKNSGYVDNITSRRSTGSILKPFLYAAMLTSGEILPNSLVPDIPTNIGGFMPQNYNRSYDGAIPAHEALARSLNIPAVRMLRSYGVPRFYNVLEKAGLTSLTNSYNYYGLSLILGGAEASLWELTGMYASMARSLNNYRINSSQYNINNYKPPDYYLHENSTLKETESLADNSFLSASAIWLTMKALLDVERPANERGWKFFENSKKISWKTGTSFGFRDAWAIGVTPKYAVGVWVGNSDGEGRPGLTGINVAAPILFETFRFLPVESDWFETPYDDMTQIVTCRQSGYQATKYCTETDTILVPKNGIRFPGCPYHHLIHLDKTGTFRVISSCENPRNMIHKSWFVLPPAMEWFYMKKNSSYLPLPEYRPDCKKYLGLLQNRTMELIYPRYKSKIFIPVELNGLKGKVVFEIAHQNPKAIIYWHIDDTYLGKTYRPHQMEIETTAGKHNISVIDNNGEMLTFEFEVISK